MDNKKDARHIEKVQKWAARVVEANDRDGEKCDDAVDEGDDLTVFDGTDGCKLNSQIMSALRSFARKYACNGRGDVARQIARRSRTLEENFERRKFCEPETTEPPTEPPTTTTTTNPATTSSGVVYHGSSELMTYSEAITYCNDRGMELAVEPPRNTPAYDHVS